MSEPSENPASSQPPHPLPCVLACSGCSRAGELADKIARRLDELGLAQMSCLAGAGGRVKSILATIQNAPQILMIDGCPLACGANTLRLAGIAGFEHLELHKLGVRKHESEASEAAVESLAETATKVLAKLNPKI